MRAMAMSARGRFRREIDPRRRGRSQPIEGMFRPIRGPSLPPMFRGSPDRRKSPKSLAAPSWSGRRTRGTSHHTRCLSAATCLRCPERGYVDRRASGGGDVRARVRRGRNPVEVPSAAVSWRVRKLPVRGHPQVAYGSDGLPLIVPIDATLAEFRSAVQLEGRYRLDPVDEHRREVADARSAYVRLARPAGPAVAARAATASPDSSDAAATAIRANLDLAKTSWTR
jgi:hypothetical protein